ncbi:MAG: hypothetical protein JJU15_09630 [Pararhodobacter sp.]|nr:hypothetical protein [Pararhodobacter sp.]
MNDTGETQTTVTVAADRREWRAERQARVGILRNPNTPPRPPPRKARLTGKWVELRSPRRLRSVSGLAPFDQPVAAPGDDVQAAFRLPCDAELARKLKVTELTAGALPAAPLSGAAAHGAAAAVPVVKPAATKTPAPDTTTRNEDAPHSSLRPRWFRLGQATRMALLLAIFGLLIASTLATSVP